MSGVTAVRQLSWGQTFMVMGIWFLPVFSFPLSMTFPGTPEILWIALYLCWFILAIAVTARIYSNPAGKIADYVQDIEQVGGEYRVGWMLDMLHLPLAMLTVVGAILYAETFSLERFFISRLLFVLITTLVYLWLIRRVWTRVSGFALSDDGSLWLKRRGRFEPFEVGDFGEVRGYATTYRGTSMVTHIGFWKPIKRTRSAYISLQTVHSRTTGTHVYPNVVEDFFYKRCENAGLSISKYHKGWRAVSKQKNDALNESQG